MADSKKKKGKKKEESKRLEEQLARALADYDNLRKRVEREHEEIGKLAKATVVARLLPVYDMLEGAQAHIGDAGIAITLTEFAKVLKEEGIEKIEVKPGDKFNEELHEAVEVVDKAQGDKRKRGKISEVVLAGWRLTEGPVIRPAKVKVFKKN